MSEKIQQQKKIPFPVKVALAVIAGLEKWGRKHPEELADIKNRLPALALRLSEAGQDITQDLLKTHIKNGIPHAKRDISQRQKSYDELMQIFGGSLKEHNTKVFTGDKVENVPPLFDEWNLNPDIFQADAFENVVEMLKKEGYQGKEASLYAYHTTALFGTTDRVLKYLEKWGAAGKTPLHDIIQDIKVPRTGYNKPPEFTEIGLRKRNQDVDLNAWGSALLQQGPRMAKFVKFAEKVPQPKKGLDERWYSFKNTSYAISQVAYPRMREFPRIAAMSMRYSYDEDQFNDAVALFQKYQEKYETKAGQENTGIPDVTIAGSDFGMDGYSFKKLPDGDVRGMFLGNMTDCCQHLGSLGRDCAVHGYLSGDSGFYVIEDKKGAVIGQTWAWRGTQGELTFDSLEQLGDRVKAQSWQDICQGVVAILQENAKDVTGLYIGVGGKTPKMSFDAASKLAEPVGYNAYRDSKTAQYCAWKR